MAQLTAEAVEIYENNKLIPAIMVSDFENDYTIFIDINHNCRFDTNYKSNRNSIIVKTKKI